MSPEAGPAETHSDGAARRKPPRRFWLFAPYVALAVLAVGWSLAWLGMMAEAQRRADAAAAFLRGAGWTVAWDARHVGGYPFRLDMDFTGLRVADPSGWAVALPALKTEAYAFAPASWVFFAPDGLTFSRPDGGPVNVRASALRGSITGWDESPPRISLEGDDMRFAAGPGAKPFFLASARNLQFYTRAGPQRQAALFLGVDGGVARPQGWVGRLAAGGPVSLRLDGVLSHTDALRGDSWRDLVRRWSDGGGTFDVHQLSLVAGPAALEASKGGVAVTASGQLEGVLETSLRDESRVRAVLGGGAPAADPGRGDLMTLRLTFRDGGAWLGPLRLAPAPSLY